MLRVGVFGKSKKQDEKRVPIHPKQLHGIDKELRDNLIFEKSYGDPFGVDDSFFVEKSGGVMDRERLLEKCDVVLLAKPVVDDFKEMSHGAIHWGWPHCVQQKEITQIAIDKELTLIAWEEMHSWSSDGDWQGHTFSRNNEIAGYAGVHHAMNLSGIDGNYGERLSSVVISHGSVSQGAIHGLQSRGIQQITVLAYNLHIPMASRIADVTYLELTRDNENNLFAVIDNDQQIPIIDILSKTDLIINGILQDTDNPLMFVQSQESDQLKPGCLIVDISCDEGMGFPFARPTTYKEPILYIEQVQYYAVDHTPSYLWNAASWEISKSLIPYLAVVMGGPDSWEQEETIRRAIEIMSGRIQNPKILSFQNRQGDFPHQILS